MYPHTFSEGMTGPSKPTKIQYPNPTKQYKPFSETYVRPGLHNRDGFLSGIPQKSLVQNFRTARYINNDVTDLKDYMLGQTQDSIKGCVFSTWRSLRVKLRIILCFVFRSRSLDSAVVPCVSRSCSMYCVGLQHATDRRVFHFNKIYL